MSTKIYDIGGIAIAGDCTHTLEGACSICVNLGLTNAIRKFAEAAAVRVSWVDPAYTALEIRRQILELAHEQFDCRHPRRDDVSGGT